MAAIQEPSAGLSIVEASISEIRKALDKGWISSVELVTRCLHRIAVYDRRGKLNSIPILNSSVFEDAAASDHRRANGLPIRPLEGIPFTVKDSYKVKGMTVSDGSPAFQHLIANEDAFTVKLLRDAGAVLIGRTNMPPMAAGGMQRGCYGRAESPYNRDYLTAAFGSGSSNGSATSTAASFASFGMCGETVSSGRSPASNNGLVTYTPSRGLISGRGVWPLYPTCDVVVPHARSVSDLLEILDILIVKDEGTNPTGDLWFDQRFITLPKPTDIRPQSFKTLANVKTLQGKRIGVPNIYIGKAEGQDYSIETRQSVLDLWHHAKKALEEAGATVIGTDFPLITKYDTISATFGHSTSQDSATAKGVDKPADDGITAEWIATERRELVAYAWDDFLLQNADPNYPSLATADPSLIFPPPPGALPDRYTKLSAPITWATIVSLITPDRGSILDLPGMEAALHALENRRKESFEAWLQEEKLDCIVFPANADVGPQDTDTNVESADKTWKNGVMYSNGNRVIRHLGIPTVTVTMGVMADTGMPVGLTFAGRAYDDVKLLEIAGGYEGVSKKRVAPKGTPKLGSDWVEAVNRPVPSPRSAAPTVTVEAHKRVDCDNRALLGLSGTFDAEGSGGLESLIVTIDGKEAPVLISDGKWEMHTGVEQDPTLPAEKAEIDKSLIIALVVGKNGRASAKMLLLD